MSRRTLPREKSLMAPEIQNPFVHRIHLTTLDKIQIAIMSVTIVPIRILFIGIFLLFAWFFAFIALWGRTPEEMKQPLTGWRRVMEKPLQVCGRAHFFLCGVTRVWAVGEAQAETADAPILVIAPHTSFFDAVIMFGVRHIPSHVGRIENKKIPLLGTLTNFTQPVFVHREDPNSRQNTIQEIKRRALSKGAWPQVVIFPEGTCTNRSCLITFKPGAFIPGVPIQPVCLKYKNKWDSVTWTWDGPGAFECLWLTLCQFSTSCEIEFLPIYYPSEEEKNDAKLFANNVRKVMAECLQVPITDHTFEDCRLMAYAAQLDLPAATGLVEFHKLSKKLGMNFDNMKELLDKFCKIAQKSKGFVTLEEFGQYLELPVSEPLRDMFELYDRNGSGTIDFREYVIGLHLVARPANNEDTVRLAFQVFDHGGKGHITQDELTDILVRAFGMEEVDVHKLFTQVDQDQDGKINYDEFKAYAEICPEYAKLFEAYQENAEKQANNKHDKVKSQ